MDAADARVVNRLTSYRHRARLPDAFRTIVGTGAAFDLLPVDEALDLADDVSTARIIVGTAGIIVRTPGIIVRTVGIIVGTS